MSQYRDQTVIYHVDDDDYSVPMEISDDDNVQSQPQQSFIIKKKQPAKTSRGMGFKLATGR